MWQDISKPTPRAEIRTFSSPDSSNIKHVAYSTEGGMLVVTFKNGSTYAYQEVPLEVYVQLRDASSVGSTFQRVVRGHFQTSKEEGL